MIQTAISRLVQLFPDRACAALNTDEYNRQTLLEFERIRDFLVLHYHATERRDSPFWRHCAGMPIPESLRVRIEYFRLSGRLVFPVFELFQETNWLSVLMGQGIEPQGFDPLVEVLGVPSIRRHLAAMRTTIADAVATLPLHQDYVNKQCRAAP
jgi:tryptophan halogenase